MKKTICLFLLLLLFVVPTVGCDEPEQNDSILNNASDASDASDVSDASDASDIPGTQDALPEQSVENNPAENDPSEDEKDSEKADETIREITNTPYEPDQEGLIGVAFYPVREGEYYPYDIGEKVTDIEDWKYLYSLVDFYATIEQREQVGENVFDDNIISRSERFTSRIIIRGTYKSTAPEGYWGYVYNSNEGIYIIATHDAWGCDDIEMIDSREISTGTLHVKLSCWVVSEDAIPDFYEIACNTGGIREILNCKESELPNTVTTTKEFVELEVSPYNLLTTGTKKYFRKSDFFTKELYTTDDGGIVYEYEGYKNSESYAYNIIVYPQ